jgi:hypothetical protein
MNSVIVEIVIVNSSEARRLANSLIAGRPRAQNSSRARIIAA